MNGTVKAIQTAIHHAAIDRAASDPDSRVIGGQCTNDERNMLWELQRKQKRLEMRKEDGFENWYLDGNLLCFIERRYSKRKIRLCYPELKPRLHRCDWHSPVGCIVTHEGGEVKVEHVKDETDIEKKEKQMAKAKFQKAKVWTAKFNGEVVEVEGYKFTAMINGEEVPIALVKNCGGWRLVDTYTGVFMTKDVYETRDAAANSYFEKVHPLYSKTFLNEMHEAKASEFSKKVLHAKGFETRGEQMEKELAEKAEAAAKAKGADVKVTVAEHADVTAIMMEPVTKEEIVEAEAVAVEHLSFLDGDEKSANEAMDELKRITEGGNVVVRWKGKHMAPIRVEGETKPYQEALKERGLRYSRKKGFWYLTPTYA